MKLGEGARHCIYVEQSIFMARQRSTALQSAVLIYRSNSVCPSVRPTRTTMLK